MSKPTSTLLAGSARPGENLKAQLETYTKEREDLIKKEKKLRFDYRDEETLTTNERRARDIVQKIKHRDKANVWLAEGGPDDVYPGTHFEAAKPFIEKSELFGLIKKMPKGAILHAHFDATVDAKTLVELAFRHPNMCISYSLPLGLSTLQDPSNIDIYFLALPIDDPRVISPPPPPSLLSTPNTFIPAHLVRDAYPLGPEAFEKLIRSRIELEAKPKESVASVWTRFIQSFRTTDGLLRFEPVLKDYMKAFFRQSYLDGISYVEVRMFFWLWNMITASGERGLSHHQQVQMFSEALTSFREDLRREGKDDSLWHGARIIYSTSRTISPGHSNNKVVNEIGSLREYMEDCLELKMAFPDIICGFDLVGHEDSGTPLIDYLPDMLWFRERQKELGLEIPFIFHAGETLGDGDAVDHNLYDAILLGTKRIGHGFSLAKHPLLMQMCRERGIAIEVCPISNELLRYTTSIETHPLPILLNSSVPVALSCDDPAMFGNLGLSYDFFQVLVASESTDILGLGKLARQSLEFSEMPPTEKEQTLSVFDKRWLAFLDDLVNTHQI